MELRHLRSFAAAAERACFTRAAESLNRTQSAISQQVAALEKELGTELFVRQGRGVKLTESGRRLYEFARRILDLVEEAVGVVCEEGRPVAGELRIAASTVPAESLLPELLAAFRSQCPEVRESLAVSDSRLAVAAVESGDADVGFIGELPGSCDLHSKVVACDELVLVAAENHPLAGNGPITLKQLRGEPIIIREPGSGTRRCVEQEMERHGVSLSEMKVAMEANNNSAIRAAVERGVGVAFLSQRSQREHVGLALLPIRGFRPRRNLYLITDPRRVPRTPARQFLEFMSVWQADAV